MACNSNVETFVLKIILEEEIMEVEPPAAGEPEDTNTDNTKTTENVAQQQNSQQKQIAIKKGEHKVYEIQEIYEVEIDSDTDPLVDSDEELDDEPDDDEQQVQLEPQEEPEERSKKRVVESGSSRPLFRQKLLYRRQDKDNASSSNSEAPEKIEEDAKPKHNKPVRKTKTARKYEEGEGSSYAKRKKIEVPKDIYNFSDDSSDE